MKKFDLNLIFLLIVSFGIISCHGEDEPKEEDFISSTVNEVNWNGIPETHYFAENDTLALLGLGDEQVLVFKIKIKGEGNYHLNKYQTHYYTTIGGDVITSFYRLDESSNSQLTITDYDPERNILKGNFETTFLLDSGDPDNHPDKLIFKNGEFKASLDN